MPVKGKQAVVKNNRYDKVFKKYYATASSLGLNGEVEIGIYKKTLGVENEG